MKQTQHKLQKHKPLLKVCDNELVKILRKMQLKFDGMMTNNIVD